MMSEATILVAIAVDALSVDAVAVWATVHAVTVLALSIGTLTSRALPVREVSVAILGGDRIGTKIVVVLWCVLRNRAWWLTGDGV